MEFLIYSILMSPIGTAALMVVMMLGAIGVIITGFDAYENHEWPVVLSSLAAMAMYICCFIPA